MNQLVIQRMIVSNDDATMLVILQYCSRSNNDVVCRAAVSTTSRFTSFKLQYIEDIVKLQWLLP